METAYTSYDHEDIAIFKVFQFAFESVSCKVSRNVAKKWPPRITTLS